MTTELSIDRDRGTRRLLRNVSSSRPMSLAQHRMQYEAPMVRQRHPNAQVLAEIDASGLRGRGGAGFPTATKMRGVVNQAKTPVVVVNGCEGEPASDKDKVLMTYCPHLVIDGALWCAAAVGASEVIIVAERNSKAAIESLQYALDERRRMGERTAVRLVSAPSHYVTGEESSLINWINGGDAKPTFDTLRPFEKGVKGKPTLVDNVETVAHVAQIVRDGAEWFRQYGTAKSAGTALVTISGAVARPGVYEVPLGHSIADILELADGYLDDVSAVLVGGYFGAWLTAAEVETATFDNESLSQYGASVGCGAIFALPKGVCGVRETARVLKWMAGESAGQCGMCVNGLASIAELFSQVYLGKAGKDAITWLDRWANQIEGRGACRFPDGTIRFLRSALKVFATDIANHQARRPCVGSSTKTTLLKTPLTDGEWR